MKTFFLLALVAMAAAQPGGNHTSHKECYDKVKAVCAPCFKDVPTRPGGTPTLRAGLLGRHGNGVDHGCVAACVHKNEKILKDVCHFPSHGPKPKPAQPTASLRATAPSPFARPAKEIASLFVNWAREHGWNKDATASNEEYALREGIFGDNLARIDEHNAAGKGWTMKMNQFGHLTKEEFSARNGFFSHHGVDAEITARRVAREHAMASATESERRRLWAPSPTPGPSDASVDWTTKGAVTEVKNQGQCGSCWSFSAAGAIEGAMYVTNGKTESLGNQELVSCDTTDNGCGGGSMDNAFKWVKQNGGLPSWSDYPYTGTDGTCNKGDYTNVEGSAVTGYTDVQEGESYLKAAVDKQPVSVAIEADQSSFQFYSSGVMTSECGTNLDHGVLAVGYGTEDGTDYWKIKNSWGDSWGVDGYIMIERGNSQSGGQCGILMMASYPSV